MYKWVRVTKSKEGRKRRRTSVKTFAFSEGNHKERLQSENRYFKELKTTGPLRETG